MNDNVPSEISGSPLRATSPNADSVSTHCLPNGHEGIGLGKSPMRVDFLRAADGTPLTKKFTKAADGTIDVEPFPNVRDLDSFRDEISTLDELFERTSYHASQNHCMLKGMLGRQLTNESRAGQTDANSPTRWLLLDLDFASGWDNVDDFIAELNPEWADVSFIWQHSASAGIKSKPGLRGHLWFMLEVGIIPASVKLWLRERNLNVPGLKNHLRLTASGMSLKWGLDISTCQNDKLIYIAPPMLEGLDDPLGERITLVKKARDLAPPPPCNIPPQSVDTAQNEMVTQLRAAAGMPARKAKFSSHHETPLMTNPDTAVVTGIKEARGFTYINLNGGDSWGYYFHTDNPDILFNFKDEPLVKLQAIAPEFYHAHRRALHRERFGGVEPYVFRNPETDQYMNMLYSKDEDRIKLLTRCSSKDRLSDFMFQHGGRMPDHLTDWTVEFDPTTTKVIDPAARWVNLFDPTDYLRFGKELSQYPQIPPVTDKILTSVVGGCETTKVAFVNWLSCLVQTRAHLGTTWLFHGVSGTGKGLLLSKILRPILGNAHVTEWTTKNFEDQFNAALEHTCLLWLDEFRASNARGADSLMSQLKNLITEETLPVRAMRTDTVQRSNFVNVIIASNALDPVLLADNDRRFNVAPAQECALLITEQEVDSLEEELGLFTSYLMHYPARLDKARTVLLNDARTELIESSQTMEETFFSAIRRGDLDYIAGFLDDDSPRDDIYSLMWFRPVVLCWVQRYLAAPDQPLKCLRDDFSSVFRHIVGKTYSPGQFARLVNSQRGLEIMPIDFDGKKQRGLWLNFKSKDHEHLKQLISDKYQPGLTVIKGGKEE